MNADALLGNRSRRMQAWRVSWLFMIVAALCLAAASCGGHPAPASRTPAVNSLTVKACTVAGLPARCGCPRPGSSEAPLLAGLAKVQGKPGGWLWRRR